MVELKQKGTTNGEVFTLLLFNMNLATCKVGLCLVSKGFKLNKDSYKAGQASKVGLAPFLNGFHFRTYRITHRL